MVPILAAASKFQMRLRLPCGGVGCMTGDMVDPVAFHIPFLGRAIYWYGIMVALGFLAALLHWNSTAQRVGLPRGISSDLAFLVMICGILGARLLYVAANWSYFSQHALDIVRIDQGGLIFYGGFLLAALGVVVLARVRDVPLLKLFDFTASALPLGHALGRIGCLLNGCCYGSVCDLPWAVNTAGAMRHPVQAYEAIFNLALFFVLRKRLLKRGPDGWIIALYLLAYGAWRFIIEFWRGDARMAGAFGLNASQTLSLSLVVLGLALSLVLRARDRRRA